MRLRPLLLVALLAGSVSADPAPGTPAFYVAQSVEGMKGQEAILRERYRLGQEEHWYIDQDTGTLRLDFADGTVATAPMQIVGSFNPRDATFLWGWANDSVDPGLRRAALLAKAWGTENRMARYTTAKLDSSIDEAWEFTAVVARLDAATGAYMVDAGGPLVFLTFRTFKLEKPARSER